MLKKLGSKLKEQKGFTLIELLAVIVILGIIAAIAIPAIGNVINKSDAKAEAQTGLQIINAAKLYAANNNVKPGDTLDATKLGEYLDSATNKSGDPLTGFSVVIGGVATGKFTFTLHGYPASGDTKTEAQLIKAAK
jgi:type IV pilus assembly protein PilA